MAEQDDIFLRWAFDQAGKNPLAWRNTAENLLEAANAVKAAVTPFDDGGMHSLAAVQAMLLGMAIECMLKGMYIKAGNSLTEAGQFQAPQGTGPHQLNQIADVASYPINSDERRVLDKLTSFILFSGRYPIATRWEKMRPTIDSGFPYYMSQSDFQIAELLAERLHRDVRTWE